MGEAVDPRAPFDDLLRALGCLADVDLD